MSYVSLFERIPWLIDGLLMYNYVIFADIRVPGRVQAQGSQVRVAPPPIHLPPILTKSGWNKTNFPEPTKYFFQDLDLCKCLLNFRQVQSPILSVS